jgi:hypothetical protein
MEIIREGGGPQRWLVSMGLIALLLVATFFAVTAFFPGDTYFDRLGRAYELLWQGTTREQFTFIMRRNPWLYAIPSVGIVLVTGWLLPARQWGRAILVYIVFFLGFVGGHVFW